MRKMFLQLIAAALVTTLLLVSTQTSRSPGRRPRQGHVRQCRGMGSDARCGMQSHSLIESLMQHATSGTDAEPNSTPFPCS